MIAYLGVVPNENCMYIIDDMVMTEEQLLEAYGLRSLRLQRCVARSFTVMANAHMHFNNQFSCTCALHFNS